MNFTCKHAVDCFLSLDHCTGEKTHVDLPSDTILVNLLFVAVADGLCYSFFSPVVAWQN